MSTEGRTSKSITNAKVSMFFLIASFLLNFISRKLFLDGLGPEVMGMRTTLGTVLGMLSLSELGIGTAVAVSLYKPLAEKNYNEINEIISLQGWLYTRVFAFISLGVTVLMFALPTMLADMQAPLEYAYLTVAVFYIGTMLSYTINYKSIVLSADQKGYKTSVIMSTAGLVKNIIQLLILKYVPNPYIYWLAMDLTTALLGVYVLDKVTRREYPWLKINKSKGYEYYKKYPQILKNTGQLFIHSITTFILTNATPWLLFSIIGLSMVTYYENYKNLIANLRAAIFSAFVNMGPAIASMIAEGDREKTYAFFWEMLSLKYFIGGVAAFGLFIFGTPFISIWLGEQYALGLVTIILLTAMAYLDYTRGTIDSYIVGYKLFNDIWAPALEGIINVVLAIVLGRLYGLNGILLGTYISLLLIIRLWKPYLLFNKGFGRSVLDYWKGNVKFLLITVALISSSYFAIESLGLDMTSSYFHLFRHVAWLTPIYSLLLFGAFYVSSEGFRKMSKRLWLLAEPKVLAIRRLVLRR